MQTYYHDTRNDDYWLIEPRGERARRAMASGRLQLSQAQTTRLAERGVTKDGSGETQAESLHAYRIFPAQVPKGEALRSGEGPPVEYYEEQTRLDRESGARELEGVEMATAPTPGMGDLLLAVVDHVLAPDEDTRSRLVELRDAISPARPSTEREPAPPAPDLDPVREQSPTV